MRRRDVVPSPEFVDNNLCGKEGPPGEVAAKCTYVSAAREREPIDWVTVQGRTVTQEILIVVLPRSAFLTGQIEKIEVEGGSHSRLFVFVASVGKEQGPGWGTSTWCGASLFYLWYILFYFFLF